MEGRLRSYACVTLSLSLCVCAVHSLDVRASAADQTRRSLLFVHGSDGYTAPIANGERKDAARRS